jgi:2-C-methyl-D-erythritol 4-phosphate cytidylyltransferase
LIHAESDSLAAIIVAAGSGERFGADKVFADLEGRAVLAWSLDAMEQSPDVSTIILVVSESKISAGQSLVHAGGFAKVSAICAGGDRRQDSVLIGLLAVRRPRWVAIHDGARPFVDPEMISRGLAMARKVGAAIAAVPVKDTVKMVGQSRLIQGTPPRANLWAAQTPQIFQTEQLRAAYRSLAGADVTDDAELLERAGRPVAVYEGAFTNIKITSPEDMTFARALARERLANAGASA